MEMGRPRGVPQNNYGLGQSKETSSLFGCVLELAEVKTLAQGQGTWVLEPAVHLLAR